MQIRCTKKVLDAIGIKQEDLGSIKEADSLLGNWYANIFSADRRKIIIFMNEKTLLSFVLVGVKKDNIKKILEMFYRGLEQLLTLEGINGAKIEGILAEYEDVEFTKTESRSVLGNMKQLVNYYTHYIYYNEGLKYCDITDAIHRINRMPQKNIDWKYSIEAFNELLTIEKGSDVITADKIKNDSTELSSKCLDCYKSKPSIVDKKCPFCRDRDFQEEILCDLNRSGQEGKSFECEAFRPMLKVVGTKEQHQPCLIDEVAVESRLESEPYKYKKALALQRLKGNPDEVIVSLKYHVLWNTAQRKPFFKDIGKSADKLNLLFEDAGEEADIITSIISLSADHIHLYLECDGEKSLDSLIKEIKNYSCRRLLSEFSMLFDKRTGIWDDAYFFETMG